MIEVALVELRPEAGRRHQIGEGIVIGREHCDVVLEDPEASRRHAVVRVAAGTLEIEDLGSTNGTFVNNERITGTRPVGAGDEIRVGSHVWRVDGSPPGATGVSPEAPAGTRGDVPPPLSSRVQGRSTGAPDAAQAEFRPALPAKSPRKHRPSAARIDEATIASYAVVGLTALAVILYFALR